LPQSELYVKLKIKACDEIGAANIGFKLPADISEEELSAKVAELRENPKVNGILVQLPLPAHLD